MRGTHVNLMFRLGVNPSAVDAATSECESMSAVLVENGQLKVATKRCGGNWNPFHLKNLKRNSLDYLDLNQIHTSCRLPGIAVAKNVLVLSS
jgi:hypothetical protein